MKSILAFLRRRPEEAKRQGQLEGPQLKMALPRASAIVTANSAPPLDQVVAALLEILDDYLPPPPASLPAPSVTAISLKERPLGMGNRRGSETRGGFSVLALKGTRLEAMARFQLWATTSAEAETAMANLNARLLADRDALWSAGILRLALEDSSLADFASTANAWRKTADYWVLYEFHYEDSDGAESLIARIPIDSDLEVRNSPERETTVVTGEMIRWDNKAAPALVIRGPFKIGSLSVLAFVPGTVPTGTVTVKRSFEGAAGPPVTYPTWAAFLNAVASPNAQERHAQISFASLADFLAAFTAAGNPVVLGDWDLDNALDSYQAKALTIQPAIHLASASDLLEIAYQGAVFDQVGVIYLRVQRKL